MPAWPPLAIWEMISRAALPGATTGLAWSCARAVVANSRSRSATAAWTVSNSFARSKIWSAPAAARWAATFGQPSRGLTILKRDSAKLPIARAAMPMFSPSCGSTRITTGPVRSWPDLVLSVPDPDITSLSDSTSEGFESAPEEDLIQARYPQPSRLPVRPYFSSEFIGLEPFFSTRPERQMCASWQMLDLPKEDMPLSFLQRPTRETNISLENRQRRNDDELE